MAPTKKPKAAKAAAPNAAATPPVLTPEGKAMLRLWLLLSTNPTFLLDPANAATDQGLQNFNPVPGTNDAIQSWNDLFAALIPSTDPSAGHFDPNTLQTYLTGKLQGSSITIDRGVTVTYAAVLTYTCKVFQSIFPDFLGWGHPSPPTMGETLG